MMTARWVEVNLNNLQHNLREVKKLIGPVRLLAVVKANGYGHGAVQMARAAAVGGADYLGVTTLEEAKELRAAGISLPILVMGALLPEELVNAISLDLTLTCNSVEMAGLIQQEAVKLNKLAKVHLNVDTGMQRYGASSVHAAAIAEVLNQLSHVDFEGLYTHFPKAEDVALTRRQLGRFLNVASEIAEKGINIRLKHCANSTATVLLPEARLDMVRIGTLLIGQCRVPVDLDLRPTWQLKARITAVRDVPRGSALGYGMTYRVKRDSKIAIVPLGFADGIGMWPVHRSRSVKNLLKNIAKEVLRYLGVNRFFEKAVLEDGTQVPIVGKIGMQHVALDVTGKHVSVGDPVQLRAVQANVNALLPRTYITEDRTYCKTSRSGG